LTPTWSDPTYRIELYHGDALEVLPELPPRRFAGVVTDPPYSSGGAFRGDRTQATLTKYVNHDTVNAERLDNFSGDNRDQWSYLAWSALWMTVARRTLIPGGAMATWTDWRQVGVTANALQVGGLVLRNVATWSKPGGRRQKGRFGLGSELVVYGTNGPHTPGPDDKAPHNVFEYPSLRSKDKRHIAEKPVPVVAWTFEVVSPGGAVLDPFMGSGTSGEVCIKEGRPFVGIECDRDCFALAVERIRQAIIDHEGGPLLAEHQPDQLDLFTEPKP